MESIINRLAWSEEWISGIVAKVDTVIRNIYMKEKSTQMIKLFKNS